MPSVVDVTLRRSQAGPWGFRMQGGVDFEKALTVAFVTEGSSSDASGLQTGDVIVRIGELEAGLLTHKQAQDAIVRCGDTVPLTVQRNSVATTPAPGTWKPSVELVGAPPTGPAPLGATYTKTSLAYHQSPQAPAEEHWDVKYNTVAKGFQPGSGAASEGIRSVSAPQALGGAPAGAIPATSGLAGFRSVGAPVTRPAGHDSSPAQAGQPASCWICGQPVSGVFLQVKGRPLHAVCFTCSTCGTSLKNTGHFAIGEKLYCQLHAREAQNKIIGDINGNESGSSLASGLGPAGPPAPAPASSGPPSGLMANLAKLSVNPQAGRGAQPCPPPPPPSASPRLPPPADWAARLNSNTAGVASNAEDFTKEFMKQLMGSQ